MSSYWKGRKPLILARAIVLGCLLPATDDPERDLAIFEKLMAIDEEGLARRAMANNAFSVKELRQLTSWDEPKRIDSKTGREKDKDEQEKLELHRMALAALGGYEEKIRKCKRPEEVDPERLYGPIWEEVNAHYAHLGVHARRIGELIEQLGILRNGERPRVGDAFCGGGSIPFEAARMGCDAFASDLNPVACMLTWGAFNIVGADPKRREKMDCDEQAVFAAIEKEIAQLGVEHDAEGNRAKAYLYCLETRCPETGWMIPLSTTWLISPKLGACAKLVPDETNRRFNIEVVSGASPEQLKAAEKGTVQDGEMVYALHGKVHRTPIRTLRGDCRDKDGKTVGRLRLWEKKRIQT